MLDLPGLEGYQVEIEEYRLEAEKQGYDKGFNDGYEKGNEVGFYLAIGLFTQNAEFATRAWKEYNAISQAIADGHLNDDNAYVRLRDKIITTSRS